MVKVKNISGAPQHFTGIPEFAADEERDVDESTAEHLSHSPFMAVEPDTGSKASAAKKDKSFKGVE